MDLFFSTRYLGSMLTANAKGAVLIRRHLPTFEIPSLPVAMAYIVMAYVVMAYVVMDDVVMV